MKTWQILFVGFIGALEGAVLAAVGVSFNTWLYWVIVIPGCVVIWLTMRALDGWWAARKSDNESTPTTTRK